MAFHDHGDCPCSDGDCSCDHESPETTSKTGYDYPGLLASVAGLHPKLMATVLDRHVPNEPRLMTDHEVRTRGILHVDAHNHEPWTCDTCFANHEPIPLKAGYVPHPMGWFNPDTCEVCWLTSK